MEKHALAKERQSWSASRQTGYSGDQDGDVPFKVASRFIASLAEVIGASADGPSPHFPPNSVPSPLTTRQWDRFGSKAGRVVGRERTIGCLSLRCGESTENAGEDFGRRGPNADLLFAFKKAALEIFFRARTPRGFK